MGEPVELALDAVGVRTFLDDVWPGVTDGFVIESLEPMSARVRLPYAGQSLRPGGTISGPTLIMLADTAMWIALLGVIGRVPLSVTSHLDIDFLRKPAPADLVGHATLLKVGRRLAVGDVLIYSDGDERPCARSSVTYAIPAEAGS
jgi:uncharacterized protein (TIGR00369 family)